MDNGYVYKCFNKLISYFNERKDPMSNKLKSLKYVTENQAE